MKRDLLTSLLAVLVMTLVLGIAYPVAVTGVSQAVFGERADGSVIVRDGEVVGSKLLAQAARGPRDFHPRPSQSDYAPAATFFSNRGPNQKEARDFYIEQLGAYLARERPYDRALTADRVPVDAVTTSASGVDPHISPANARIQARRVAAVRDLPLARVQELIDDHTDRRFLGVLGEPGVNVTTLNLALDGTP